MIHRKTEGHPLFATGVFQLLAERGDVVKKEGSWSLAQPAAEIDLAVPESVRSMISNKLEVLESEDRRVLQFASVQGEEFLSTILAASLEADELDLEERLDRLERVHRLIQKRIEEELPDGSLAIRYRFAHALYQNYLYVDLLTKRRTLLHRQAGEAMVRCYQGQTGRIATALAMHFERGRDFPRAVEHLSQAGDNASKLLVYTQACEHFSWALELADKLPEQDRWPSRVSLYKKRGDANLSRGRNGGCRSRLRFGAPDCPSRQSGGVGMPRSDRPRDGSQLHSEAGGNGVLRNAGAGGSRAHRTPRHVVRGQRSFGSQLPGGGPGARGSPALRRIHPNGPVLAPYSGAVARPDIPRRGLTLS